MGPFRRFVCAGSLNVDITFATERLPRTHEKLRCASAEIGQGGAAANTAHWLANLGNPVVMLGRVGNDAFGDNCIAALADVGVETSHVQRSGQAATGVAVVFAGPHDKRMVTSGSANAQFDPSQVPDRLFGPGVHLHLSVVQPAIALPLLRQAKQRGASTSADLNTAPEMELLRWLDLCFINHTDLGRWLGMEDPRRAWELLGKPANLMLVVTQGASGASAIGREQYSTLAGDAVTVVDRTGGGDAFVAGYLHSLAQTLAPQCCLASGLRLAAQVIAHPGARPAGIELGSATQTQCPPPACLR